jgi:hypothetical protein
MRAPEVTTLLKAAANSVGGNQGRDHDLRRTHSGKDMSSKTVRLQKLITQAVNHENTSLQGSRLHLSLNLGTQTVAK